MACNACMAGVLLLFMLDPGLCGAQVLLGARITGLAGAAAALPDDSWQVFANPAMIASDRSVFSVYVRRNYNLAELTDYAASLSFPSGRMTAGGGVYTYGNDLFRQTRFMAVVARHYHGLRLGLRFTYTQISLAAPYGSAGQFGLDAGFGVEAAPHLWIGGFATNLNQPKLGKVHEELPQLLDLGLCWQPVKNVTLLSSVQKDISFPASVRVGVEWHMLPVFILRAGVTTRPTTFSLGAGIHLWHLSVDLAAQHHQWLGWSPGLDFEVEI